MPAYKKVSPPWWPATMFVPWGLGILVIILNYVQLLPGSVSNWYVFGGLGLDPRRDHRRHPVPLSASLRVRRMTKVDVVRRSADCQVTGW